MAGRRLLALEDLLNPEEPVDVQHEIQRLQHIFSTLNSGPVLVPPDTRRHLQLAVAFWAHVPAQATPARIPLGRLPPLAEPLERGTRSQVRVTKKTILETLYTYPAGAYVEYPESGNPTIGHLFRMDPQDWTNPATNFAYSLGAPDGQCKPGEFVTNRILINEATGEPARCQTRHSTCKHCELFFACLATIYFILFFVLPGQGIKACQLADHDELRAARHTSASRGDIQVRLAEERQARLDWTSPQRDVFIKTVAYISAAKTTGCRRLAQRPTEQSQDDRALVERLFHRGYSPREPLCDGQIVYCDAGSKPYLR